MTSPLDLPNFLNDKTQNRQNARRKSLKIYFFVDNFNGNYAIPSDIKTLTKTLDECLRRKIRMCFLKQWKKIKTKHDNLIKLGIGKNKAWEYANTRKSYWRIANSPILVRTLTNE